MGFATLNPSYPYSLDILDADAAPRAQALSRLLTGASLKDRAHAICDRVIGQEMRGEKGQSR